MRAYEHYQVSEIFPYLEGVRQFLLAGPADGDEAQCLKKDFPEIEIFGFEPSPLWFNLQNSRPFPGTLLPYALWSECCQLTLRCGDSTRRAARSASVCRERFGPVQGVEARTIDNLSEEFEFHDAFLWLDIEGAELEALKGAEQTMPKILGLNVEEFEEEPGPHDFLLAHGFTRTRIWGEMRSGARYWWNAIYTRER